MVTLYGCGEVCGQHYRQHCRLPEGLLGPGAILLQIPVWRWGRSAGKAKCLGRAGFEMHTLGHPSLCWPQDLQGHYHRGGIWREGTWPYPSPCIPIKLKLSTCIQHGANPPVSWDSGRKGGETGELGYLATASPAAPCQHHPARL